MKTNLVCKTLRILALLTLISIPFTSASAQLPTCTVSGTIYKPTGGGGGSVPAAYTSIFIVRVVKDDALISSEPVKVTSNFAGVVTFVAIRNSDTYVRGPVVGLDVTVGKRLRIPDAPTADLGVLIPTSTIPPEGVITKDDGVALANPAQDLNFTTGLIATDSPAGQTNVSVDVAGLTSDILPNLLTAGSCTVCSLTYDAKGRVTVVASGPTLGTAATRNVPASGNAGSAEVVLGNDGRLSDSRTPTAHTHTASQVSDFNSAVDARISYPVTSVFGRTGAVVAATNDYTWAQINKTTSSLADLTTRSASDLSSGTVPDGRFPATLPSASGANLTNLNASNLATGRVPVGVVGFDGVKITSTANQSIPNIAATAIAFNSEGNGGYDTATYHDTATNNTRITFPRTGYYTVQCMVTWAGNGAGDRVLYLRRNGAGGIFVDMQETNVPGANRFTQRVHVTRNFTGGDYVELLAYQSSGGALDVVNLNASFGSSYENSPACEAVYRGQ